MTHCEYLKSIVLLAGVSLLLAACGSPPGQQGSYEIKPVDDPLRLPYRFNVYASQTFITENGGSGTGDLVPVVLDSSGAPGCYLIGHNWWPDAGLTSLLLYRRVEFANAVTHLNIRTPFISSHRACDFDHDGNPEVAIAYATNDTLWLDIKDFTGTPKTQYHRMLLTGSDRNDDGYWDGRGFVCATHDFTGDGYDEIIASSDVGYDLYPRLIFCLDWQRDTILWQTEISGIVGANNVHVLSLRPGEPVSIVVDVSSKGNAAVASEMSDAHSYLLVLDSEGELRWWKETGDVFYGGQIALFDSNDDGAMEILSAQAFDKTTTTGEASGERWGSLVLYDGAGVTLDSISLGPHRAVNDLCLVDLEGDGLTEIAACLDNGSITFYNRQLQPLKRVTLYTRANVWGVDDYLARGDRQMLLTSYDRKLWLVDDEFKPLAQLAVVADRGRSTIFKRPDALQSELVLSVDGGSKVSLVSFASTSWTLIFYRNPWLAFLVAFVPLSLLVLVMIVWIGTWRRKNILLAEARTRDAAYRAHKSLIAGIGHRLRNSMSLAVMNTQTLRARYGDKLDDKAGRLLQQIESSLQSTSENISALSTYERIHQEKCDDPIDLRIVAEEVNEAYRPMWEESGTEIELVGGSRAIVRANENHMRLLFDTLIKNGLDALANSPQPQIKIEISRAGSTVNIEYRDNGPGLAPQVIDRLGKEIISTKPTTGLGIGILSTFEVVKAYGGEIKYRDRDRGGVAVSISLPGAE
ncbi:MAG: ATP-binding protein [bacterium]